MRNWKHHSTILWAGAYNPNQQSNQFKTGGKENEIF